MANEAERNVQVLAETVVREMFAADQASQKLGMHVLKIRPGYARVKMSVLPEMLNGFLICHGGFIFALADSTFAFACNTHNVNTVASGCMIDYLAPAYKDDVLMAEAVEQAVLGRMGVYDVAISNQKGERIALFRGKSCRIKGEKIAVWNARGGCNRNS